MTQRLLSFSRALWQFMQSPRLLFYLLLYFMVLLVVGTLAQKYIGLFSSTHLFFNSFFFWLGGIIPIPMGASVLLLLCLNLVAHFISASKWSKPYLGSTLAHLSVIILLCGGGITLMTKHEGFMLLRQNETVQRIYDYHQREIVLFENDMEIAMLSANHTTENKPLALPSDLGFAITPISICKNCTLDPDRPVEQQLQIRDINLEDEVNQWGMIFSVATKENSKQKTSIATTEFMAPQFITRQNDRDYYIAMRRKSRELPFALRLDHFTPRYYIGTDIAKSFESSLHVIEQNQKTSWPALISMNDPLRYQGYTFYQSSFLTLPNDEVASVLNVVKNAGWLFPYIATFMLFAGLLIHLGVRRHAPN